LPTCLEMSGKKVSGVLSYQVAPYQAALWVLCRKDAEFFSRNRSLVVVLSLRKAPLRGVVTEVFQRLGKFIRVNRNRAGIKTRFNH